MAHKTSAYFVSALFAVILCCLPFFASAASLVVSPGSGAYEVGDTFTVSLAVASPGEAVNAVSGVVSFDPKLLEAVAVSKNQSIVSLWVQEPTFLNSAGSVRFEGIALNPGFTGASGKIISVSFRVKGAGRTTVAYSSGSVLANDGNGTDVLSNLGTATFTLADAAPSEGSVPPPAPSGAGTPELPVVTLDGLSAAGWLPATTGIFHFTLPSEVVALRLLLDDREDSTPLVVYEPPIAEREIKDLPEGVSFLHAQYKNAEGWGAVLHYRVQVDTAPPEAPRVVEVEPGVFSFSSHDALSGIDHYEVQIDGAVAATVAAADSTRYTLAPQAAGAHTLTVQAVDGAGNRTLSTASFTTLRTDGGEAFPEGADGRPYWQQFMETGTTLITILSIVIPFIALVLTLGFLLFFAWHAQGGLRRRIDAEVAEAKEIIERAFALLRTDLEEDVRTLERASKKRTLTREEAKILKRLRQNINEAEQVILKEVADIEAETH